MLYQTHRELIDAFKVDVPDGWYEIELHFAEIYSKKQKKVLANNLGMDEDETRNFIERAFDVIVNDEATLTVEKLDDYR